MESILLVRIRPSIMVKSMINLLPPEVQAKEKNQLKIQLVKRLSIGTMVVLIIITATVLVLRLIQNQQLATANDRLKQITQTVDSLNVQENLLLNLKKRLASINSFAKQPQSKSQAYEGVLTLVPNTTKTNLLSIDKAGNVVISGESSNSGQLQTFFNNLIDPDSNQKIVSRTKIESLSRTPTSKYRFEINAKLVQ